uniref:Uncharacterized protein n=1 Tax=Panagrolaimus superbus TaxID=310955 RepID=A0A914Z0Q7_9BILA
MAIVTGHLPCTLEIQPTLSFVLTKPRRQYFSFPSGIIHYISHTPSSYDGYQNLLQSCKYFVFKKYIVISDTFYVKEESNDIMLNYLTKFDVLSDNLRYKLWMNRLLTLQTDNDATMMTKLLRNTYRCNLIYLTVSHQTFSYNEYLMLVEGGKLQDLVFWNVVITYDDGTIVPFENMLENVPNINEVTCSYTETPKSAISSKTIENLLNLPIFNKLVVFKIYDKYPKCNAQQFCDFIKKTNILIFEMYFTSAVIDEKWFKTFETNFENTNFIAKKKIEKGRVPFSKSTKYHDLTVIEIRKKRNLHFN